MIKHFHNLNSNEQRLVKYGLIIITMALFWALVYKPLTHSINGKIKYRSLLQSQLTEMQASEMSVSKNNFQPINYNRDLNKPFISWIDEQLENYNLALFVTRSEPKDNSTLILTFESVAFDDLIKWLQPLEQKYNISITEADINLTDRSNGLCNARLTLEDNQ